MEIREITEFKAGNEVEDNWPMGPPHFSDRGWRFDEIVQGFRRSPLRSHDNTLLFFLGEAKKTLSIQHVIDIDFAALDVDGIVQAAQKQNSKEIYIAHLPKKLSQEQLEENGPFVIGMTPETFLPKTAISKSENDYLWVLQFTSLAKRLEQHSIKTVDVVLYDFAGDGNDDGPSFIQEYSSVVSQETFPGLWYPHQVNSGGKLSRGTYKLNTEEEYQHIFDAVRERAMTSASYDPCPHAYAFAVEPNRGYWDAYRMPLTNRMQIPGLLEGRKLMPGAIFGYIKLDGEKQGDKERSLVIVVDKQIADLSPDEDDIAFVANAKEISEKINLPIKEIIFLGQKDPVTQKYDTFRI